MKVLMLVCLYLTGCFVGYQAHAAYKDPCNPYTTEVTTDVIPGYYENISGQCVQGDVNQLQNPTPHDYNYNGMVFYNGYNPTPPISSYYNNQSIGNRYGGHSGRH